VYGVREKGREEIRASTEITGPTIAPYSQEIHQWRGDDRNKACKKALGSLQRSVIKIPRNKYLGQRNSHSITGRGGGVRKKG